MIRVHRLSRAFSIAAYLVWSPCTKDLKLLLVFFAALLSEFQCSPGIEVSFLIDASGSVGENNFLKVQNFTQDVTRQLKSQYEKLNLTIITFNNEAKVMPIKHIHVPMCFHINKLSFKPLCPPIMTGLPFIKHYRVFLS